VKYLAVFCLAVGVSIIATLLVRRLALRLRIIDWPRQDDEHRHIHKSPTPLLGGLAVFVSFFVVVLVETFFTPNLLGGFLLPKHIFVICLAGLILVIGGFLDDKYTFKPWQNILFPIASASVIIAGGIGIDYLSNPFGNPLYLNQFKIVLFSYQGLPYQIVLLADLFTFLWMIGMSYTTKLLDGLDGLVSGVTVIGALIIFMLSLAKGVAQPETAILALALAGCYLGFLVFNWHPSRIMLGEGGSIFAGFMLAVLSILSGSKIATTLLVVGIPVLDVIWVIIRRIGKRRSPFWGDRAHLHFRLLDVGLSHRQAVLFLYSLSLVFGLVSLFVQGKNKVIALVSLAVVMLLMAGILVFAYKRKTAKTK